MWNRDLRSNAKRQAKRMDSATFTNREEGGPLALAQTVSVAFSVKLDPPEAFPFRRAQNADCVGLPANNAKALLAVVQAGAKGAAPTAKGRVTVRPSASIPDGRFLEQLLTR